MTIRSQNAQRNIGGSMKTKKYVQVINRNNGEIIVETAKWCSSRLCRLRGLQFTKNIKFNEGLILVKKNDTVSGSSIHMFFVFFPIAAIWINNQGIVTSTQLAKPWRPYYASPQPARYVLEASPDVLNRINIGDEIEFL